MVNINTWAITGVAGFIGSNILEVLLHSGQNVLGLDNFMTGHRRNLDMVRASVGEEAWKNFSFFEGDVRNLTDCGKVCRGADFVLHQAALGSVPQSIKDPLLVNQCNVDGFVNMLVAARDSRVRTFVYATSSAVYGDDPTFPKNEENIGLSLSPYATTKHINELYAHVFHEVYGLNTVGLRYFNVFGPRQDPSGAYAAVIPQWFSALLENKTVFINGDGETTRDFCHVENCVYANIYAAQSENPDALNTVYNIALGKSTSLNELFLLIKEEVSNCNKNTEIAMPHYQDFREGDIRHSVADIRKAQTLLGYVPRIGVKDGLAITAAWYCENL